jgi:AmmeMemoRadiSam system protein A
MVPDGTTWPEALLDPAADAALLRLARAALEVATGVRPSTSTWPPTGGDPGAGIPDVRLGAFVTLTIGGELRGCMGRLDFDRSLAENVVAAAAAVTRDPRFPPLGAWELPAVRVEVSAITEPVPIPGPEAFDVTRHGIVVERGYGRALLLPQVARERGWDARRTLRAVCEKAGLDGDDWKRPETRLSVFVAHEAIEPEASAG